MSMTPELIAEVNLLTLFSLNSAQEGLKVHASTAAPEAVSAAERLFEKNLITQNDGGYLTSLGIEAAEHAQHLLTILS